jgi:hypothetical protein
MNTHVVCKPLPAADGVLPSGTQVDASDWAPRKVQVLIASRFLRPLAPNETDNQPAGPRRQRGREVHHGE